MTTPVCPVSLRGQAVPGVLRGHWCSDATTKVGYAMTRTHKRKLLKRKLDETYVVFVQTLSSFTHEFIALGLFELCTGS